MSEYMPTEDDVFFAATEYPTGIPPEDFTRWLRSVKAKAWLEGWHDSGDTSLHYTDNPYEKEES